MFYLPISVFIAGQVPCSLGLVVSPNHCVPDSSQVASAYRNVFEFLAPGGPCFSTSLLLSLRLWVSGSRGSPAPRWPPGQGSAFREPALLRGACTASPGLSPGARGGRGLLPGDQCFAAANWVFGPQPERAAWEPAPGVGADGAGLRLARAWGWEGPGPAADGGVRGGGEMGGAIGILEQFRGELAAGIRDEKEYSRTAGRD